MENQCKIHQAHVEHFERIDERQNHMSNQQDRMQECLIKLTQIEENNAAWIKEHDKRIKLLEAVPAKKWEAVTNYVLVAVLGVVLGIVASHFGL